MCRISTRNVATYQTFGSMFSITFLPNIRAKSLALNVVISNAGITEFTCTCGILDEKKDIDDGWGGDWNDSSSVYNDNDWPHGNGWSDDDEIAHGT